LAFDRFFYVKRYKTNSCIFYFFGTPSAKANPFTFHLEVVPMKKVLSTIVAALVALSFSAVVFAKPAAVAAVAAPAAEKKEEAKPAKKPKKHKKEAKPADAPAEAPKAK
jgi:hypothetical protein